MDLSASSSSSDDELFIIAVLQLLPRPRLFRDRSNPLADYDDVDFKLRFRLSKLMFMDLIDMISNNITQNTLRNVSLSPILQLLIALRYYATGAFQAVLGDVHKSTVCRVIKKVSEAIALLKPKYIKMSRSHTEINLAQDDFLLARNFPKVIGANDCTHIKIQSPNSDIGEKFQNRKDGLVQFTTLKFLTIHYYEHSLKTMILEIPCS